MKGEGFIVSSMKITKSSIISNKRKLDNTFGISKFFFFFFAKPEFLTSSIPFPKNVIFVNRIFNLTLRCFSDMIAYN